MKFNLEIDCATLETYNELGAALNGVAAVMFRHDTDALVESANPADDGRGTGASIGGWSLSKRNQAEDTRVPADQGCAHKDVDWSPVEMDYQTDGTAAVWQEGRCRACKAVVQFNYHPSTDTPICVVAVD
jgi:hypothetical protein